MENLVKEKFTELVKLENKYPNDIDFGKNARITIDSVEINRNYPNDMQFGKTLRNFLRKKLK